MPEKSRNEIWDVVKSYSTGGRDSVVVCIPYELRRNYGISAGQKFIVETDGEGHIILKRIEKNSTKKKERRVI